MICEKFKPCTGRWLIDAGNDNASNIPCRKIMSDDFAVYDVPCSFLNVRFPPDARLCNKH